VGYDEDEKNGRYPYVILLIISLLKEARQNLPVARKWGLELMFDRNDGEQPQMYPLRYIEDFSPSLQLKSNPKSAFAAGRGFASLP
jgi:hypothetical protein